MPKDLAGIYCTLIIVPIFKYLRSDICNTVRLHPSILLDALAGGEGWGVVSKFSPKSDINIAKP